MAWAPDYATDAELKAYARIDDAVDDAQVALAIAAASRAVDRRCARQFGQVDAPELRTYPAVWDRRRCRWVVRIDDLMTTTGLQVGGVAFDADVHRLEPLNAAQSGQPWTQLVLDTVDAGEVAVTALWGWTAVPSPVKQATLMQANRFLHRRESPWGVAGSPDVGTELRLLERVDPDVSVILAPFVRWWGGV